MKDIRYVIDRLEEELANFEMAVEQKSEIKIDAIHWKEIFQDEEAWQNCSDSDYKELKNLRDNEDE